MVSYMHIVCFLHSIAVDGSFMGMHTELPSVCGDILESTLCIADLDVESLNEDLKDWIGDRWTEVKDSAFKVEFQPLNWEIKSVEVLTPIQDQTNFK
jgi:hypothetical protein